eukprot:c11204_g1_i1.p1 GENE.c11204_g1_i1~~c11204_g1_i1.p1  ORF type:complete len:511 (+),score=69.73 c11204_g1_i1:27-1559(+)
MICRGMPQPLGGHQKLIFNAQLLLWWLIGIAILCRPCIIYNQLSPNRCGLGVKSRNKIARGWYGFSERVAKIDGALRYYLLLPNESMVVLRPIFIKDDLLVDVLDLTHVTKKGFLRRFLIQDGKTQTLGVTSMSSLLFGVVFVLSDIDTSDSVASVGGEWDYDVNEAFHTHLQQYHRDGIELIEANLPEPEPVDETPLATLSSTSSRRQSLRVTRTKSQQRVRESTNNVYHILRRIEHVYSEAVLVVLGILALKEETFAGIVTLVVSFVVMLLNAIQADPSECFGNFQTRKLDDFIEHDASALLEFLAPRMANGIVILLLPTASSASKILDVVVAAIAAGYLLVSFFILALRLVDFGRKLAAKFKRFEAQGRALTWVIMFGLAHGFFASIMWQRVTVTLSLDVMAAILLGFAYVTVPVFTFGLMPLLFQFSLTHIECVRGVHFVWKMLIEHLRWQSVLKHWQAFLGWCGSIVQFFRRRVVFRTMLLLLHFACGAGILVVLTVCRDAIVRH